MLAPTGLEAAAIGIATKSFSSLVSGFASAYAKRVGANAADAVTTNLTPYLDSTFRRCATIKTLLNPLTPADFLSIYSTQRFDVAGADQDHNALVELIRSDSGSYIVTGLGGSGKSMFMRYLWMALFEDSAGRIPVFLELRTLNLVQTGDLLEYVFQTITSGRSNISRKEFDKRLYGGDIVLVLDGFDELTEEKKDSVQAALLRASHEGSGLQIVMSGRPDQKFSSWPAFHVVSVSPLQKNDVIELVERAEFDSEPKANFLKRIREGGLFEKHSSMLSNPLLASMMLLTFSYSNDIPDQMHLFYEQAFDALYQRHDSYKPGGYKREFKSGLGEDDFKRLLAYFCLATYHDRRLSLNREDALSYVKKAASVDGVKVEPSDYLHDLTQCVCVLTHDGFEYSFSHRSFQEFFAAYCLARVTSKGFRQFCEVFSERTNDQVMDLLSSMNPEAFREMYVLPFANDNLPDVTGPARLSAAVQFSEKCDLLFGYEQIGREVHPFINQSNGYLRYARLLARLQQKGSSKTSAHYTSGAMNMAKERAAFRGILSALGKPNAGSIVMRSRSGAFRYLLLPKKQKDQSLVFGETEIISDTLDTEEDWIQSDAADSIFQDTFLYQYIMNIYRGYYPYLKSSRDDARKASKAMSALFSI